MPLLNFKKQFADKVLKGEKCQTIRAYRKDGRDPKQGDTLYLYTGCRTKNCEKLKEVECKSVQKINFINFMNDKGVCIIVVDRLPVTNVKDRKVLEIDEIDEMAKKDGFKNAIEFVKFFNDNHGLPFEGLLIKW